jgi:hypothetical protein
MFGHLANIQLEVLRIQPMDAQASGPANAIFFSINSSFSILFQGALRTEKAEQCFRFFFGLCQGFLTIITGEVVCGGQGFGHHLDQRRPLQHTK